MNIKDIINKQKEYFNTGKTMDIPFRLQMLTRLKESIKSHEDEVFEALRKDLNKPEAETMTTELGLCYEEIDYFKKHLKALAKAKRVRTPIYSWPAKSYIYKEPYGVVLIIGPFNYPFQLNISPLIGAIAAGNCALIKPSKSSKATTLCLIKIIEEAFPEEYVKVIEPFGGREEMTAILKERYDYIFFTGSVAVGKVIMEAAAKHLTPVTLELGGKSPALIDKNCDLKKAAKRIAWGKFINAGQTCIAPDYVLLPPEHKEEFIAYLREFTEEFYGSAPSDSPDYPKIIDERQFDTLVAYLSDGNIAMGGSYNREKLYIAPTVLTDAAVDSEVMTEEIFGPILPIIEYSTLEEAIGFINSREKPLALYFFTKDDGNAERVLRETSSGGGCINDTIMHVASNKLPFGGVGNSGMGSYHGEYSFKTFTHERGIIKQSNIFDLKLKYPPYKDKIKLYKKIFK
ncbi:MAG: aldehyde dehydrogenase [Clostridiaceae bacterium]